MKTNKSYKEAVLRAYSTEKDTAQDQENLLKLRQQTEISASASHLSESPVIETHKNIMRSWLNLRGLDQNLDKSESDKSKKTAK